MGQIKKIRCLIAIVILFATGMANAQNPSPVKVEQGLLQGTNEDGLTVYKGIPFAAPPVGDLRWRAAPARRAVGRRKTSE